MRAMSSPIGPSFRFIITCENVRPELRPALYGNMCPRPPVLRCTLAMAMAKGPVGMASLEWAPMVAQHINKET